MVAKRKKILKKKIYKYISSCTGKNILTLNPYWKHDRSKLVMLAKEYREIHG